MNRVLNKISIAWNDIQGQLLKIKTLAGNGFHVQNGLNENLRTPRIIVSLTSYGRRVKEILPYTLVSLLKQTVKADKIVLWLDETNWNEDNLPETLKILRDECGVEVEFCEEMRSFKKLIPALKAFPDDIIITVDDDIYYSSRLIERMYHSWLRAPDCIHCIVGHEPMLDGDGRLLPYDDWRKDVNKTNSGHLFPVGAGGVLYSPRSLDEGVVDYELARQLAPFADDIWFWVMAKLKGTEHKLVDFKGCKHYSLDSIYQYLHSGASLMQQNVKEKKNDIQLHNVCEYYNLFKL